MQNKIGLKILAISIALVMVVSSAVVYGYNTADVAKGTGDDAGTREGTTIIEEEAGISFYINVSAKINLTKAKAVYRTTEHETENYTIGAVALPGYPVAEDVHVYVHKDGWIVAYYLNDEPVAKIINWFEYQRPHPRDITHTKLKDAVVKMCDGAGVPLNWSYRKCYDFRVPNANRMMFVTGAQRVGYERSSTFKIKLPGDLMVCERSWSHFAANSSNSSSLSIDEHTINSFGPCRDGEVTKYGTLTQTQLKPEVFNTVRLGHDGVNWTTGEAFSAIALLYRTGTSGIESEQCESVWRIYTAYPKELINDTTPPLITNVTVTDITNDSAAIKWDTDEIANSLVKYGKASGNYTKGRGNPLFVKNRPFELTGLLPGTCYYFVVNSADQSGNLAESSEFYFTTTGELTVFDTEAPANPYPSISGTHNGTITPNQIIEVATLYTYPCAGTGGHTEYIKIWNKTDWNVTANWHGYKEDWHTISFDNSFTLEEGETYYYSIRTGSYPQIHHTDNYSTPCGFITCSEFMDAKGKKHKNWIPAIRLWAGKKQSTQTEFTDKELLDAAYSGYKYPEGFYQEDLHGGSLYYENTVSIKPVGEREHIWIELCTNNKSQALEWSESSSKNSAYYRDLVDEKETEKYFEFRRVYSKNPSDVILSRVHKCDYLNRSKYDKSKRPSILGTFNQRPVTIEKVKELIEYLWFIENYNWGGQKVLRSFTENQGNSVKHTLYKICIVYGDWGVCDVISLFKSEYIVDKNSGEITVSHEIIKTVTGKCH